MFDASRMRSCSTGGVSRGPESGPGGNCEQWRCTLPRRRRSRAVETATPRLVVEGSPHGPTLSRSFPPDECRPAHRSGRRVGKKRIAVETFLPPSSVFGGGLLESRLIFARTFVSSRRTCLMEHGAEPWWVEALDWAGLLCAQCRSSAVRVLLICRRLPRRASAVWARAEAWRGWARGGRPAAPAAPLRLQPYHGHLLVGRIGGSQGRCGVPARALGVSSASPSKAR